MTGLALVTGAAGFLGSHAAGLLLEEGYEVRGLDNFDAYYEPRVKRKTADGLRCHPRFRLVVGDLRDPRLYPGLLRGVDLVLHFAARPGVRASLRDRAGCRSVNIGGTRALLDGCASAGVSRLIFASSSSVYGELDGAAAAETDPVRPVSPYGWSKYLGERLSRRSSREHGIRVAALRFFTVFGARQRPDLAAHRFLRALRGGQPVPRFGDGSSMRAFTHVADAMGAVRQAVRWTESGPPAWEVFNVGSAASTRLDYLIDALGAAAGILPRVRALPPARGDVRRTAADGRKAARCLGFAPTISLEDGLRDFVKWYDTTR